MKLSLAVLVVCLAASAYGAVSFHPRVQSHPRADMWQQWKLTYNKVYETEVEEINRFRIWADNLKMIEDHNVAYDLGLKTYNMKMNMFGDLTSEEFAAQMLIPKRTIDNFVPDNTPVNLVGVPDEVDWNAKGYVTPVKNQGQCGSCWSFSTTGALEGAHYNATGNLVSLSEQELVDCDTTCYGCGGGWPYMALQYFIDNGAVTEASYPYYGYQYSCRTSGIPIAATMSSYSFVSRGNEDALKAASATVGPISICIDASPSGFAYYSSGVFYSSSCSSTSLDHAVLLTGYGHDSASGMDYWWVKNSWGASWGENGYIKMARNYNNNCGVATEAVYAIV